MSNRLPGSTGKLTLGSVEPGSGLGKSRQKTGAGGGKGKKRKIRRRTKRALVPGKNFS